MGKKLKLNDITTLIKKDPNVMFDICSVCEGVEKYGTMKDINSQDFDLICEECLNKQDLIDAVIDSLKEDFNHGDYTVLEGLLGFISRENLIQSLDEDEWPKYKLKK